MDLYLGKLISIFFRMGGYIGLALITITIINSIYTPSENKNEQLARKIRNMDYKHGNFRPSKINTDYKVSENSCVSDDKITGKMVHIKEEPNVDWKEKWIRQNGRLRKTVIVY